MGTLQHAYLIIAHADFCLLEKLIESLDRPNSDVFLHINVLVNPPDVEKIRANLKYSHLYMAERVEIYWGDTGVLNATISLLKCAMGVGRYDYFHLMTGSDLPIKPMNFIEKFYEDNLYGTESGYKTNYIMANKVNSSNWAYSRISNYRLGRKYWRKGSCPEILRFFVRLTNYLSRKIQKVLGYDRYKSAGKELFWGSSWWSLSDEFILYLMDNLEFIEKYFSKGTFASDEFAIQTVFMNSPFKSSAYKPIGDECENLVRLSFERGKYSSPYIFMRKDYEELIEAKDLFARKFSTLVDSDIITMIIEHISDVTEE